MVGACQYRIFNVPPWPRPPAAGLAAAVGATVGPGAAGAVVGLAAGGGAAAGAVVAWPAGGLVGWAAGAAVGADVADGPHAASTQVKPNRRYAGRLIGCLPAAGIEGRRPKLPG